MSKPDYKLAYNVDNTIYDKGLSEGIRLNNRNLDQVTHYHINMAAFIKLGERLDYLRANGVWNNTRIILYLTTQHP